jgi:hypothetical protein
MLRCVGWRCVLASASLAECRSECPSRSGPFEGPATESLRLCRRIITDRDHAGEILQQGEARERHGLEGHALFSSQASPAASGHFKVRTWPCQDARQHWLPQRQPPQGTAPAWTGGPRPADDSEPWRPDPRPDILWSAPGSDERHASIGLGDAHHLRDWPRDGPGGQSRRTTSDPSRRAPDRTFYGPHPEAPRSTPALAWAMLTTSGNGHGMDQEAPAHERQRIQADGPRTGHSMVRTWKRRETRQHWLGRC